mgnify:CR=1 FL=1
MDLDLSHVCPLGHFAGTSSFYVVPNRLGDLHTILRKSLFYVAPYVTWVAIVFRRAVLAACWEIAVDRFCGFTSGER